MLKECGGQGHAHFSPASASTPAQGLRIGVDLVARDHAPGWSARLPVWSEVWSLKVKTCAFLYQFKWWTQCHSNDGFFGETCPIFSVIIYLSVELGTKLTKVAEVEKYFSPWIPTQHRNAASFKLDSTMVYSTPGIPQVYVSPMEPLLGRSSGNGCFFILWSTCKKSISHGVTGDYHPQIMQEFIRIWHHQLVSGQFPSDFTWASKPTSGALRWALGFACAIAGSTGKQLKLGIGDHRGTARMVLDYWSVWPSQPNRHLISHFSLEKTWVLYTQMTTLTGKWWHVSWLAVSTHPKNLLSPLGIIISNQIGFGGDTVYPLVIKHGNGKSPIYKWFTNIFPLLLTRRQLS